MQQNNCNNFKGCRLWILLALLIIFIGGIVSAALFFSSDLYEDKKGFEEYANIQLETDHLFQVSPKVKTEYDFGRPVSFAVNYQDIEDERIEAFRDSQTKKLKKDFAIKNLKKGDLAEALIIDSAVRRSDNGTISLAIYRTEHEEKNGEMIKTGSFIDTYIFNEETGKEIIPEQTLKKNYRSLCSKLLTEYFQKNYSSKELNHDWSIYLDDNDSNFNKFIIRRNSIIFYFDQDTVLKKEFGVVSARISNEDMKDQIRSVVLKRYIFPDKPMVALTYDDGPGGESETRILNCLEANNSVATFFYYGSRISANAGQIRRAYELGCEIGNHTWSHPVLTKLKPQQVREEISKTNEAIKSATGEYPTLLRPSYGETNDAVNAAANLPVILWSVDTNDWKYRNAAKVFSTITGASGLDGKIILMHSIHTSTAEATEMLVPWLKQNGYQTVTVSEMINYKYGEVPKAGKIYR